MRIAEWWSPARGRFAGVLLALWLAASPGLVAQMPPNPVQQLLPGGGQQKAEPAPAPDAAASEAEKPVDESAEASDKEASSGLVNGKRVSKEQIEAELAKNPAPAGDAPPTKARESLHKALDALSQEAKWTQDLADYKKSALSSERLANDLNAAKNEAAEYDAKILPDSLDAVEAEIKATATKASDVKERVDEFTELLANAPQLRVQQSQRRNELASLIKDLDSQELGGDAESLLKRAQLQAYEAEQDYLEFALSTADSRKDIRQKRLEIARIRQAALTKWSDRLKQKSEQLRRDALKEQERAMRETAAAAAGDEPLLKRLAEQNASLLQRRKELSNLLRQTLQTKEEYEARAQLISRRLDEIQRRVEISGFSQAAAAIMLKELTRLPAESQLDAEQRRLEIQVRETQLEIFDLAGDGLTSDDIVERYRDTGAELAPEDERWLRQNEDNDTLAELLEVNREINQSLREDANDYFEALLATDSEIIAAAQAAERFRDYASENILWIPSRNTLSTKDLESLPNLVGDAVHEFTGILDSIVRGPVLRMMVFLVVFVILVFGALRLSRWMGRERLRAADWGDYGRTLRFAFYELLLAILPLVILHLLAWALDDPDLDGNLANAIEYAARKTALGAFTLVLLYRITRPRSMGELELRWPAAVCARINRAIHIFFFPALIFTIVGTTLDQFGQIVGQQAGTRVFLIPSLICCLGGFHLIFSPRKGILAEGRSNFWRKNRSARWTVYFSIVGWQFFLLGLVVGGYMLGALMLWGHTFRTLWLIAGILIIKGMVQRYLEIQHWRAKMQQLEEEASGNEPAATERLTFSLDDSTRQVIGFLQWVALLLGISAVWSDAFPSLRKMGAHPLVQFRSESELTLGQGTMLLVCIVTTVLLARSLPRLIEILILRRIGAIDPGTRHAFATLVTYVVVITGVIWASSILAIEWGQIQWLVAAISVGLGFGMQEIFGNLVAGIILLFERPIRVGDIVTVGSTTGKVTRIQMRGTTIQEWDRRELIVPNKEFVTGQLTNWTLSDTLTRLTLNVGVAYGSDISQVRNLLLEAIKKDHRVLNDPGPAVYFQEFGESSLNFLCFAYLGTLDERLGAASDLQQNIYEALNAAGITIPFPQRDLHIIDGYLEAREQAAKG